MSDILYVISGLLLGLAFQGGMWLFLIPFAGVACTLAIMNRPRLPGGKTTNIPVVTRAIHATGLVPATSPDLRSEYKDVPQEYNEPNSTLKVNQIWNRADADIDKAYRDMLIGLKGLLPAANTLIILSRISVREWAIRSFYNDGTTQVATDVKIGENSGLLGQLFRAGVDRLLEGDLMGGKALMYYVDNPNIKSLVAVPIFDRGKNRAGALIVDSLYPNAFNTNTSLALSYIANNIDMLGYKSYASAKNYIEQQQFSVLYYYQRKFFQTMSVKDIYKQIFEYVKENIPFDRLLVLALDKPDGNNGHVVFCDGVDSEQFVNKPFTLNDKGICVLALLRNRLVERDFSNGFNEYVPRLDNQEKRNMDLLQLLVMPVPTEASADMAELAICLESRFPGRYSEHDKELLKAFAGVAGFAYDRARKFEQGKDLAMRDGLTGLINHRTLHESLRTEKIRADRRNYNIGVLMMDIDHFKRVNDTYGHPVGDEVIKGIAGAISGEIRKEIDVVARYGGEEFVVGLIDTTPEGMIETAERIRKAVGKLTFDVHLSEPLRVTVSIGAFLVKPEFHDMKKAVNNADQALYKAKEGGRNQVIQYTEIPSDLPEPEDGEQS